LRSTHLQKEFLDQALQIGYLSVEQEEYKPVLNAFNS